VIKLLAFGLFDWVEQIVDGLQHFLLLNVILAPLLLLFIEECGLPLPINGDIILAYTGYRLSVTPHAPAIWEAFVAAQLAALAGATVLFFLSRRWGQMIIIKLGKFIFLEEKHIRHAERLFARWGVLAIIFGRHIPGLRIPVTIFAATSGLKYPVFLASTFVSTSIWILFYLIAGKTIGRTLHTELQHYVGITIAGVVALVVGFLLLHAIGIYRRHHKAKNGEAK
jgi:membrane protein DedA with SNARE-associated domain